MHGLVDVRAAAEVGDQREGGELGDGDDGDHQQDGAAGERRRQEAQLHAAPSLAASGTKT
jgi:hypothetical protein